MSLPTFTVSIGSRQLFSGELSALDAWIVARRRITFFSICSGIEAASVAWKPLGWKCVGVAEIEKFPSAVLAHHYPNVPNHGDFTKIKTRRLGRVDILCGGTPCQAFSVAGARNSLDDARGNLTLAFVELAHELVPRGLRNVVWENVPGVLSTKDNAFGCFLAGLVGASGPFVPTLAKPLPGKSNRWWGWSAKERNHYIKWPRYGVVTGPKGRAAWTVKDAQYYGLAQRRERVLVVADFGNGADPAAVLFEPESVPRHSPPSRETGERVAPTIAQSLTASGRGVERTGDTRGQDPVVACYTHAIQAGALRENPASGPDGVGVQADIAYTLEARAEVQAVSYAPSVAPTMRAGGNTSGGDRPYGTDVDTCDSLIAYAPEIARCDTTREGSSQDYESTTMVAVGVTGPISHALKAEGADASEDGTGRGTPIIAFAQNSRSEVRLQNGDGSIAGSLSSETGMNQTTYLALSVALRGREDGATAELGSDVAFALRAAGGGGDKPHILTSAVRRLTPRECERLMGFPDDYTAVPWRGKPAALCPDGPRYKALGNSWAVPKFRWLGERIARLMPRR